MILATHADLVFLIGGLILDGLAFLYLLDPQTALSRWKTVLYTVTLFVMALTYLDLGMTLSAFSFGLGSVIWGMIAVWRAP